MTELRMRILLCGLVAVLCCVTQAFAKNPLESGTDFVRKCGPVVDFPEHHLTSAQAADGMFCLGYVQAFFETSDLWMFGSRHQGWCSPKGFNVGQMLEVIVKHARTHPEEARRQNAVGEAIAAFADAFPCQKQAQPTEAKANCSTPWLFIEIDGHQS